MKSIAAFAAFAGAASAQSLAQALNSTNQTSVLLNLVASMPDILNTLSGAKDITLLAPNNAALDRFTAANGALAQANPGLIPAVLTYHVINGTFHAADLFNATNKTGAVFPKTYLDNSTYEQVTGGQYVEVTTSGGKNVTILSGLLANSSVVQADIAFDGGVIHVIDNVLSIPQNISTTAVAAGLSSLVGTLSKANLVNTVEGLSNITVFAPTNTAFQNIGGALANLSTQDITNVLTYHVVNSSVLFSSDIQNGTSVPTLNGGNVTFSISGDSYFVNGAKIAIPNVLVSNGVVHVIGDVLNPANSTARPANSSSTGAVQFGNATASNEAPNTSGVASASSTIVPPSTSTGAAATRVSASSSSSSTGAAAAITHYAMPVVGALAAGAAFLL